MDLTDIIYSNDYINILIQNYVAQSERYQMLFPESSALLTLNSQYSVLFLERSLLPENLFGAVPFYRASKTFYAALHALTGSLRDCPDAESLRWRIYRQKCNLRFFWTPALITATPHFCMPTDRAGFSPSGIRRTGRNAAGAVSLRQSLYKSDLDAALKAAIHSPLFQSPIPTGTARMSGVGRRYSGCLRRISRRAPEADFAVVKLKPAKQNLKDFYLVSSQCSRLRGR